MHFFVYTRHIMTTYILYNGMYYIARLYTKVHIPAWNEERIFSLVFDKYQIKPHEMREATFQTLYQPCEDRCLYPQRSPEKASRETALICSITPYFLRRRVELSAEYLEDFGCLGLDPVE